MAKTIKQIADDLGVSKQAVFKKIDNLGLRSELTKNGNQFAVDDKAEMLIKQGFVEINRQPVDDLVDDLVGDYHQPVDDLVDDLIAMLQRELDSKNKVIEEQAATIKELGEALKLANQSINSAHALHAGTIQKQLTADQTIDHEQPSEQNGKKTFFQRIFGK